MKEGQRVFLRIAVAAYNSQGYGRPFPHVRVGRACRGGCVFAIMARGVNAIVLAAGLLTACATIADDGRRPGTGCECVLIGNSAVRSVATELEAHAVRCGYLHHKPFVAFADNPAVSPQQLWARIGENEGAKAALKGGTTSIFVMAWDESCGEADDFRDWIELALACNPGITVCIVAPWPRHRGMTYTEARRVQNEINARLHATVAELRANYPQLYILCIPQGDGMLELWRLYEEGRLPGVDGVYKTSPDDAGQCLYAATSRRAACPRAGGPAMAGGRLWIRCAVLPYVSAARSISPSWLTR